MGRADDEAALARYREMVVQLDAAFLAIAGGVAEYTLNTGQTTQKVTRTTLGEWKSAYASCLNQIAVLETRLGLSGTVYVRGHA